MSLDFLYLSKVFDVLVRHDQLNKGMVGEAQGYTKTSPNQHVLSSPAAGVVTVTATKRNAMVSMPLRLWLDSFVLNFLRESRCSG